MAVAIVTDSAADLPPALARDHGIEIVPLLVTIGDRTFRDGVDLDAPEFWRLAASTLPTTASPPPAAFAEAYRRQADAGAGGIVSLHLSAELSSATANAERAADGFRPSAVRVVDSRLVGVGLGVAALATARAATHTPLADADEIARVAADICRRVELYAALETVDFLHRGGRLGAMKAALTGLLKLRPVLTMRDGVPSLVARGRTRSNALDEMARRLAGPAVVAAVSHAGAPDPEALADLVEQACGVRPIVGPMGPTLGSHLGPGAVGVAILRP